MSIRTERWAMSRDCWWKQWLHPITILHGKAETKHIQIKRKRTQTCLWVLLIALVLESIFRIIQKRLPLSEPRKNLEMKRCLQSCTVLLGFSWAFSIILHSADNLWCECIWYPEEKWVQCQFRKFPTCYCPNDYGHILSKWIARSPEKLM